MALRTAPWLLALVTLAACGRPPIAALKRGPDARAAQRAVVARGPVAVTTVRGVVSYERRSLTERGYSSAVTEHPARFVRVRAVDALGRVLSETRTDAEGRYALTLRAQPARIVASSSVREPRRCEGTSGARCTPAMRLDVAPDREGRQPYELAVRWIPGSAAVSLRATLAEPRGEGGAFHILDTLVTGMLAVHRWSGRELAPFFVIWSHASGTDWSYYRGERPEGSGRYALELMGGEPGRLATTDADQHDVCIILHEFGHFVFDTLGTDSSVGGMHPASAMTSPGVAWEEGRATWFASAILGDARYRDAVGIEPAGSLRQDDDLEQLPPDALRGPGSQRTVEEVLWDLSDGPAPAGAVALADRDGDGVSLGPAAVFSAMLSLREVPGAVPSLVSFLRRLVATGALEERAARGLLERPVSQRVRWPAASEPDPWPLQLALPGTARGKIDGVSDPAPSGGRAHPVNGFDAMATYRVTLVTRGTLTATLTIQGTGRAADRQDLDLELRDHRSDELAHASGQTPVESISRVLAPGTYLLVVRDGGNGNSAHYTLTARTN